MNRSNSSDSVGYHSDSAQLNISNNTSPETESADSTSLSSSTIHTKPATDGNPTDSSNAVAPILLATTSYLAGDDVGSSAGNSNSIITSDVTASAIANTIGVNADAAMAISSSIPIQQPYYIQPSVSTQQAAVVPYFNAWDPCSYYYSCGPFSANTPLNYFHANAGLTSPNNLNIYNSPVHFQTGVNSPFAFSHQITGPWLSQHPITTVSTTDPSVRLAQFVATGMNETESRMASMQLTDSPGQQVGLHSAAHSKFPNHATQPTTTVGQPVFEFNTSDPERDRELELLRIRSLHVPSIQIMPYITARFFVIKSFNEEDIHRSIKYGIWCSTIRGNERLNAAYYDMQSRQGSVFLLFSVNSSGHFCGAGKMNSSVNHEKRSSVWIRDKWIGEFQVLWLFVKDIPNSYLRHIRIESNENKPVTNSRDCTEILPPAKGLQVLKLMAECQSSTSLFDDYRYYEEKEKAVSSH